MSDFSVPKMWADQLLREAINPSVVDELFCETRDRTWRERLRSRPFTKRKRVLKPQSVSKGAIVRVLMESGDE